MIRKKCYVRETIIEFRCPKASTDVKISIFFVGKWGDEAVDHEMDL